MFVQFFKVNVCSELLYSQTQSEPFFSRLLEGHPKALLWMLAAFCSISLSRWSHTASVMLNSRRINWRSRSISQVLCRVFAGFVFLFLKDITFRYCSSAADSFSGLTLLLSSSACWDLPSSQLTAIWESPCWCKNTISCLSNCVIWVFFIDATKETGTKDVSLWQAARNKVSKLQLKIVCLLNGTSCSSFQLDAFLFWNYSEVS